MVWSPDMEHYACEAAKIAPLIVQYMQGRSLDIGSGHGKVWPQAIGIDMQMDAGVPVTDIHGPGDKLSLFADESVDAIFSSHFLEDIEPSKVPAVLREWWRVMKVGAHLILYLPDTQSEGGYPHIGEPNCNPGHKWEPSRTAIIELMKEVGSWTCLVDETRLEGDEYSFLQCYQKNASDPHDWDFEHSYQPWERNPEGKKRALVIRYGAIGDAIVAASILPHLKDQGYFVTFNTTPKCQEVIRHDPHIDEWLIQDTDFVPNRMLGPFWEAIGKRYDKVVNLSESVEGLLLAMPGRLNHGYSAESRRRLYDGVNYLEHTHNIADVPQGDYSGARFYPTADEAKWALAVAKNMRESTGGGPIIVWCVNGSSPHKVYAWTHVVCKWLLDRLPCKIVLYGDPGIGKKICDALIERVRKDGGDASRIFAVADKWNIRQSMTFARFADVMVGPETGPMNGLGMEDVPKVIYLSHSSPDNLTKHWVNTTTLTPEIDRAPCFPCHQLHYDWTHCHQHPESHAALCATGIRPETVLKAVASALGAKVKEEAA